MGKGKPGEGAGFVMHVKVLTTLISEHVVDQLDHQNFNLDVAFLQGRCWNEMKMNNDFGLTI